MASRRGSTAGLYSNIWIDLTSLSYRSTARGQWYRYHHLFRDMLLYWLQARYTADEIAAINRQAAAWYARNGYVDVAVRQLSAAGADQDAADLIQTEYPRHVGTRHLADLTAAA